jgi:hypothetical protein
VFLTGFFGAGAFFVVVVALMTIFSVAADADARVGTIDQCRWQRVNGS